MRTAAWLALCAVLAGCTIGPLPEPKVTTETIEYRECYRAYSNETTGGQSFGCPVLLASFALAKAGTFDVQVPANATGFELNYTVPVADADKVRVTFVAGDLTGRVDIVGGNFLDDRASLMRDAREPVQFLAITCGHGHVNVKITSQTGLSEGRLDVYALVPTSPLGAASTCNDVWSGQPNLP